MRDFLIGVIVVSVVVLGGGYYFVIKPDNARSAQESLDVLESIKVLDEDTELPAAESTVFTPAEL